MKAQIVSFHCVLRDKLGQVLGTSFNQDVINQVEKAAARQPGSMHGLVPEIQNLTAGEKRQFTLLAQDAYGPYEPDLVVRVARSELKGGHRMAVGAEVVGRNGPEGSMAAYRVTRVEGDMLVLDANHPLAGVDLIVDIEVVSARDACREDFEEADAPVRAGPVLH